MKSSQLLDAWSASGSNFDDFTQTLSDLENSTYAVTVSTDDLTLLHPRGFKASDPNGLIFELFSRKTLTTGAAQRINLDISSLKKSCGVDDAFIKELLDVKLMLQLNKAGAQPGDIYFASKILSRDIAARAGLAGDAVYEATMLRDEYIMDRYVRHPNSSNIIIRRDSTGSNRVHKVFAVRSSEYTFVRQTILLDMADHLQTQLGDFECRAWHIDHFITQLKIAFPERAADISATYGLPDTFIPCVLLETSNTGDCSVRAVAMWENARHSYSRIGEYEHSHRGDINTTRVLNAMEKTLMPKYTILPERLCELLTITVDPVDAIEFAFKGVHADKLLQKRRAAALENELKLMVSSRASMTGYEIAMLFMELPSSIPAQYKSDDYIPVMEKIAGMVPFLKFENIAITPGTISLAS